MQPWPVVQRDDEPAHDLSIIIVSWNVHDLLRVCLRSIAQARTELKLEVIVVDSASKDGSPTMVRSLFPWVKLIECPENVGFARGNNMGIATTTGRYLLLLNPDTEIIGDALDGLVSYLDEHPDVGVVGPQLLNPDGTIQSSRRRFPSLAVAAFESTWLESLAPRRILRGYYAQDLSNIETADVDWLTGACLMVRSEIIDHVGGLDEEYFMYSEELDWCWRIRRAGWRVVYLPTTKIVHHSGKSSEQAETNRHINFQRAKLRYFRKHHGRSAAMILRMILLMNYSWQLSLEGAKGIVGHKRSLRWRRVQSYWQVLRSGLRPAGY